MVTSARGWESGEPPRTRVLTADNARFAARKPQVRDTAAIDRIWAEITNGQEPFATVLGCADSRLAPEVILDRFVGDVLVVRAAGNIAASPPTSAPSISARRS